MSIMVYAKYGRTAVYQIQELMRWINRSEKDMHVKVKNCEKILNTQNHRWAVLISFSQLHIFLKKYAMPSELCLINSLCPICVVKWGKVGPSVGLNG